MASFNLTRRGLLAAPLLLSAQEAPAQAWPARAITLVVPWAPGGVTDIVGRLLAEHLAPLLGASVTVENRPGAAGTIGHAYVARARPDGATILLGSNSTYAIAPLLYDNLGYDDRALAPVGKVALNAQFLCVPRASRARNVAELLADARARPGGMTYATAGAGSTAHLAGAQLSASANVEMIAVPYRGGAPAVQALVTREVDFSFAEAVAALPLMFSGDIRALAVTTAGREPRAPEVPTMMEAGIANYTSSTDLALFTPAGLSPELIRRLTEATHQVLRMPAVLQRFASLAIQPVLGNPEDFVREVAAERAKWRVIIERFNIRLS